MAKMKVVIDTDVDFRIEAMIEAFGLETSFRFRRKKVIQGSVGLSESSVEELFNDEYSEDDPTI